jgi:hypothetical protein
VPSVLDAVNRTASKGRIMKRGTKSTLAVAPLAVIGLLFGSTPASAAPSAETERILALFSGHDGIDNPTWVHASGPANGYGTETQVLTGETPDGDNGQATFHLRNGDLIVDFSEHDFQLNFNPTACSATTTSDGTMTVTGATGSLTFTTSGHIFGQRGPSGECLAMNAPPKLDLVLLTATGAVALAR